MKWISAWSSVIGSSHIEEGIPCQDSSFVKIIPDSNWIIAAVSDGAGSSSHSDIGSSVAVNLAIQKGCERIVMNEWLDDSSSLNCERWKSESYLIFKEIREELLQLSLEKEIEFGSLACTLIIIVSNGDFISCSHVGDGRAAFLDEYGEWTPVLTPYKGEEANQTVFLTSECWIQNIENECFECQFHLRKVIGFTLMSDGCERAAFEVLIRQEDAVDKYYDPNRPYVPFFDNNIQILKLLESKGAQQDQINGLWSRFLTDGNGKLKIETDDKSLVLSIFTTPNVNEV